MTSLTLVDTLLINPFVNLPSGVTYVLYSKSGKGRLSNY